MVDFVDVLVETSVMEELVHKEMPRVFNGQTPKQLEKNHIPAHGKGSNSISRKHK